MSTSKALKLLFVKCLCAHAYPCDSKFHVCPQLLPIECPRVHLYRDLTFLPLYLCIAIDPLYNLLQLPRAHQTRCPSAHVQGLQLFVILLAFFLHAHLHLFQQVVIDIPVYQVLRMLIVLVILSQCIDREVTVVTLAGTKGKVQVNVAD
jgi:hypothetical protein